MIKKLQLFLLPFLIALVIVTVGYSLIHYYAFIKHEWIELDEFIVLYVGPGIFSFLLAFFYFKPRFLSLEFLKDKSEGVFQYALFSTALLAAPAIVTQNYLAEATSTLTETTGIQNLDKNKLSKYYRFKENYLNKLRAKAHSLLEYTDDSNEKVKIIIYVAVPFQLSETDTTQLNYWYGLSFDKTIEVTEDPEALDEAYKVFAQNCQDEFDLMALGNYDYLERLGKTTARENLRLAIEKEYPELASTAVVLMENNKPYEPQTDKIFPWIFIAFGISTGVFLVMILIKKIDPNYREEPEVRKQTAREDRNTFLELIRPQKDYYVTPMILILNVLIFLAMVASGAGFIDFKIDALIRWGGNLPSLTRGGEWWRLFTSTFLHGGLLHVGFNMYALIYVGPILERVMGNIKFLALYVASGIIASGASLWWHGENDIVSIGASGAIFGTFGCFLALLLLKKFTPEFKKAFLPNILFFVGFNLLYGMQGGIDNAAHIGGLVSGFLLGIIFSFFQSKREIII